MVDNPVTKVADKIVEIAQNGVAVYGYGLLVLIAIAIAIVGIDKALYVVKTSLELFLWFLGKVIAL